MYNFTVNVYMTHYTLHCLKCLLYTFTLHNFHMVIVIIPIIPHNSVIYADRSFFITSLYRLLSSHIS